MRICLFGSGSKNIAEKYLDMGYQLGKAIAINNHDLVFGGGDDGMMGSVARGCHDNGGMVIGIIPEWMSQFEALYKECDEIIYTKSMDERKLNFVNESDLFIISPGGIGTLDEFFDVLTLKKLKKIDKNIIILNFDNFFDKMLDMLYDMAEKNFVKEKDKDLFVIANDIAELNTTLKNNRIT